MLWHLIAAIFAGLGSAGIAMLLRQLSGKRLPRWIIPVFAGLGILGYQIYQEYSWFDHKQLQLPAQARVVDSEQRSMVWRPWTYFAPITNAFTVIDSESETDAQSGETRVFQLYRFERAYPDNVSHHPYLLNCTTRQLVPLEKDSERPIVSKMRTLTQDAPVYRHQCPGD